MAVKLNHLEFYQQYVQEDFKKKDFDQSRIQHVHDLSIQAKKYFKNKSLPKEWNDEMIVNFLTIYLYRQASFGAEFKYLQEKYYPHFLKAYGNIIEIRDTKDDRGFIPYNYDLFLMGFKAGLEEPFKNNKCLPLYADFILRLSFWLEVNNYTIPKNMIQSIISEPEIIISYIEDKSFINHLLKCLQLIKYGVTVIEENILNYNIYCASILCLLFSKNKESYSYINHIIDTQTLILSKRNNIYWLYFILKEYFKKENDYNIKKMINYIEEHYPEEWLIKHLDYIEDQKEIPVDNQYCDIYSFNGVNQTRHYIPYIEIKEEKKATELVLHYKLNIHRFNLTYTKATLISIKNAYSFTTLYNCTLKTEIGRIEIPHSVFKDNSLNEEIVLIFEDQYKLFFRYKINR